MYQQWTRPAEHDISEIYQWYGIQGIKMKRRDETMRIATSVAFCNVNMVTEESTPTSPREVLLEQGIPGPLDLDSLRLTIFNAVFLHDAPQGRSIDAEDFRCLCFIASGQLQHS